MQSILGDWRIYADDYFSTEMWHESYAQRDGTIRRRTADDNGFASDPADLVLSGPHFFLANPLNKTPRRVCKANSHYDVIDLETLPDDYLPRTNYHPMPDRSEYLHRTPRVSWSEDDELYSQSLSLLIGGLASDEAHHPAERTLRPSCRYPSRCRTYRRRLSRHI